MSNLNSKSLFLFRGLPGSGKTTVANKLCKKVFSADDHFYNKEGLYCYVASEINIAHEKCIKNCREAMEKNESPIGVANTFSTEEEITIYYNMAKIFDYTVFSLIVENRHGKESVHHVPIDKINLMKNRFDIKLI